MWTDRQTDRQDKKKKFVNRIFANYCHANDYCSPFRNSWFN